MEEIPLEDEEVFRFWSFGFCILAPILCLLFDPIVFRTSYAGPYAFPCFLGIGMGVLTMALWLGFGSTFPGPYVGFLFGGFIFSFAIGLAILPLSIIGFFYGFIGIFGFTPFVTAVYFWRNGRIAWKRSCERYSKGAVWSLLLFGIFFSCGFPWALYGIMRLQGMNTELFRHVDFIE